MQLKDREDAYVIQLRADLSDLHSVSIDGGLSVEYGYSGEAEKAQLGAVFFAKDSWTAREARSWWADNSLHFVPKDQTDTRLPLVNFVVDDGDVYIVSCLRNTAEETTLRELFEDLDQYEQLDSGDSDIDGIAAFTYLNQQGRVVYCGTGISFDEGSSQIILGEGHDLLRIDYDPVRTPAPTSLHTKACVVRGEDHSLRALYAGGNTPEEAESKLTKRLAEYVRRHVGDAAFSELVRAYRKQGPDGRLTCSIAPPAKGPSGRGMKRKKRRRERR